MFSKELELSIASLFDKAHEANIQYITVEHLLLMILSDYEVKELSLAVALAEKNIIELEKNLSAFFSYSKSPISILHFVSAYFYLSLIHI